MATSKRRHEGTPKRSHKAANQRSAMRAILDGYRLMAAEASHRGKNPLTLSAPTTPRVRGSLSPKEWSMAGLPWIFHTNFVGTTLPGVADVNEPKHPVCLRDAFVHLIFDHYHATRHQQALYLQRLSRPGWKPVVVSALRLAIVPRRRSPAICRFANRLPMADERSY